uniref:Uncharacterized protein n=1 Tax=Arundo donax TaxID=35708 RepID=A0A0A9ESE1_ARUDO
MAGMATGRRPRILQPPLFWASQGSTHPEGSTPNFAWTVNLSSILRCAASTSSSTTEHLSKQSS